MKIATTRAIETLAGALNIVLSLLVATMFSLVLLQVIFRHAGIWSLSWTEELARYVMIFIAFLGGALAYKEDAHPRVDFLYSKLPYPKRLLLEVFLRAVEVPIFVSLLYVGTRYLKSVIPFTTPTLGISYLWVFIALPLGLCLTLVFLLLDLLHYVLYKRSYIVHDPFLEDPTKIL